MPHARWAFVVADTDGAELDELVIATQRKLTCRLDGSCEASVTVDGRDEKTLAIEELASDLIVYREGEKLFRGRINAPQDTLDGTTHSLALSAVDYRAMLRARYLHATDTLVFANVDQGLIAWELIADSEARSGAFGIIQGTGNTTGVGRDRTYEVGKNLLEALEQLGRVDGGFEWEIDADLAFNVFYPERGANNGFVLDYGGTVQRVTRSFDPTLYGSAVRVTGADTTTPEERTDPAIATLPEGRMERQFAYPDVVEQTTLDARADFHIADVSVKRPAWAMTMRPDSWSGPSELWLGDTVIVVVRSGRLNVAEAQRVVAMQLEVNAEGVETVTPIVGHLPPEDRFLTRPAATEDRLAALERRTG